MQDDDTAATAAPSVIGEARTYDELIALFRKRCDEFSAAMERIDEAVPAWLAGSRAEGNEQAAPGSPGLLSSFIIGHGPGRRWRQFIRADCARAAAGAGVIRRSA